MTLVSAVAILFGLSLFLLYALLHSTFGSFRAFGAVIQKIKVGEISFSNFIKDIFESASVYYLMVIPGILFFCVLSFWIFLGEFQFFNRASESLRNMVHSLVLLPFILAGFIILIRKETPGWPIIRGMPAVAIGFLIILASSMCMLLSPFLK